MEVERLLSRSEQGHSSAEHSINDRLAYSLPDRLHLDVDARSKRSPTQATLFKGV